MLHRHETHGWTRGWTRWQAAVAVSLLAASLGAVHPAVTSAQETPLGELIQGRLQQRANGAVTLMSYTVIPDASASSLSIDSASTDNPGVTLWQLGAGFTLSSSFPLYLEGFFGYSRYDPTFVASNGQEQRAIPVKWTTIAGTIGVGWDFPLFWDIKFRPIFNASIGHVESDLSLLRRLIEFEIGRDLDFLDGGQLNVYGLGGAAMLDYERYREKYEIDVELRYTFIHLQSFDSASAVEGTSDAETLSLWSRLRVPTGLVVFRRPLRAVFEYTNTTYLGDQAGVLGFNYLNQFGLGLELDTSAYHLVVTRVRFVMRYVVGENVDGLGGGFAVTFF